MAAKLRLQKSTFVFSKSKLITHFQTLRFTVQISEERGSWRTGRRKIAKLRDRAIKAQKCQLFSCSTAFEARELNCQTTSFHGFPLKIYSAGLGFCKLWLVKGWSNCRGGMLCGCTSKEQWSRTKQQTVATGWFGTHQTVECSTRFLRSYGTIYVCFHSGCCRISLQQATVHLVVSAIYFFSL